MRRRSQRGQALVEFVALVPVVVLLGLIAWQMAVAGHAWIQAAGAARAGARAAEVGAPSREAALGSLMPAYARGARVGGREQGSGVRVRLRVPGVLHFVAAPTFVEAEAGR